MFEDIISRSSGQASARICLVCLRHLSSGNLESFARACFGPLPSILRRLERDLGHQLQLANRRGDVQLQRLLARPWATVSDLLRRWEIGHG